MPSRLVALIGKQSEADKQRKEARNLDTAKKRIRTLLEKINPGKDPSLLDPVEGVSFFTRWEKEIADYASIILLDEMASRMLEELPIIDSQLREEIALSKEIGAEGIKRIPVINLKNIQKIIEDLEEAERGG